MGIQIIIDDLIAHLNNMEAQAFLNTNLQGTEEMISCLLDLCEKKELDVTDANDSRVIYMRILEDLNANPSLDSEDMIRVVIPSNYIDEWRSLARNLGLVESWGQLYPKFQIGSRSGSSAGPDKFKIERFVDEYRHAPEAGKMEMLKRTNGEFASWRVKAVYSKLGFEYLPTEKLRELGRQMDDNATDASINTNVIHYPLLASLIKKVFEENDINLEEAYSALTTTTRLGRKGYTQTLSRIASALPLIK